jgi:sec-independent protein translocase protein TatA
MFLLATMGQVNAFVPSSSKFGVVQDRFTSLTPTFHQPAALQRQRHSVAQVQTMGLFGLGAPEIGIILVAAAFLLGPEKLASLGKDAGKIAGELKEVPKEFQKGLEEGEAQAKATKKKLEAQVEEKSEDKSE